MAKASSRLSKKVVTGITPEEFNEALGALATANASKERQLAKMEAELTRAREKYADDLAALAKEEEKQREIVQAYCVENKGKLFSDKRSMHTIHGVVGFRMGTPKLKTLPRWTWDKVLDKLKTVLPEYVRTKTEVDKESLLAAREDKHVAGHLNEIGVYVDQDEAFYVDLKKEEAAEIPA